MIRLTALGLALALLGCSESSNEPGDKCETLDEQPPALHVVIGPDYCDSCALLSVSLDDESVTMDCQEEDGTCECWGGERAGSYELSIHRCDVWLDETVIVEEENCSLITKDISM